MKKILISSVTSIIVAFSGMSVSFAQDGGPPQFRPVELWACSYRDGKDQGDFAKVLEDLTEVTGDAEEAVYQLFPYFRGPDQAFDFIYLGVWPDGSTMGGNLASYFENSAAVEEAWDEVAECPVSVMYASMRIQDFEAADGSGNFMISISDCNVGHAVSNGQAISALSRYNDYRVANGSTVGTIAWFPAFGGGNAEFDFKLLNVFSGPQAFGDQFQWYVDNQAYTVEGNMTDGIVSCDEARVYNGTTILNNLN